MTELAYDAPVGANRPFFWRVSISRGRLFKTSEVVS